jgi:metal-responsive CopG/Arc/MetJ family transcriptional regulator
MANPFFSGRIPQFLADKVDAHLTDIGKTRSELLLKLLRQEVGDNETDNDNERDNVITDLIRRVERLEQLVSDNAIVITKTATPAITTKKPRASRSKKVGEGTTEGE